LYLLVDLHGIILFANNIMSYRAKKIMSEAHRNTDLVVVS
jgi:hypothetical protein